LGIESSSVVIDAVVTVAMVFRRVKPGVHADQVLAALG
jgi:peroxiredoxin